jgi:hypothetical protein
MTDTIQYKLNPITGQMDMVNSGSNGGTGTTFTYMQTGSLYPSYSVSFTTPVTVYNTEIISSSLTITPNTTGSIAGYGSIWRAVGNGTGSIVFSGINCNDVFDNTLNQVNLITLIYDNTEYWASINLK